MAAGLSLRAALAAGALALVAACGNSPGSTDAAQDPPPSAATSSNQPVVEPRRSGRGRQAEAAALR